MKRLTYDTYHNIYFRQILGVEKGKPIYNNEFVFLGETEYLAGLLCAVYLRFGDVKREVRVATMEKGQNQEKSPSKWASHLQNSEIEVRGEAGVPGHSHSDA